MSADRFRFRAWNDGRMVGPYCLTDCGRIEAFLGCDFTVMQSTGLLDSNGVEIYEGDILAQRGINIPTGNKYDNGRLEVAWRDAWKDPDPRFECDAESIYGWNINREAIEAGWIVIGNKYQNPELMKGV